jgi:hypothetical protein
MAVIGNKIIAQLEAAISRVDTAVNDPMNQAEFHAPSVDLSDIPGPLTHLEYNPSTQRITFDVPKGFVLGRAFFVAAGRLIFRGRDVGDTWVDLSKK